MKPIDFSQDAIGSEKELREMTGIPHELVIKKTISIIDDHCKSFISMSPLFFLSTSDAEGTCDVSPRGDQQNSIQILNEHQLVIPDRLGNRRHDSILNILTNPHVGLLFLIPGLDEVLRINGRATVIKNKDILGQMSLKGKAPKIGIGVDVEECFIHCPRALKESNVWKSDAWPTTDALPSMMDIFHAHLKINGIEVKKS